MQRSRGRHSSCRADCPRKLCTCIRFTRKRYCLNSFATCCTVYRVYTTHLFTHRQNSKQKLWRLWCDSGWIWTNRKWCVLNNCTWKKYSYCVNLYFSASRSDVKMKLEMTGFNLNECANIYRTLGYFLTNGKQLCAGGEDGKDSCNGDSGELTEF